VIQDDKKPSCIVEDNVLVTEDGIQVLSRRQTKLWLIPCGEGESV
jgi:methionine aminopeptidase